MEAQLWGHTETQTTSSSGSLRQSRLRLDVEECDIYTSSNYVCVLFVCTLMSIKNACKCAAKHWHRTFIFQKIIFYSEGPIKLWQIFTNNYFLASHYRYINWIIHQEQSLRWTDGQVHRLSMKRCIKQTAI